MRRRDLLKILGSVGMTSLGAASALAQQQRVPRLAIAVTAGRPDDRYWQAFFDELRQRGWIESQNIKIERYSFEGQTHRYAELARDVVRTKPDIIATVTSRMVHAFKAATTTIPIVMASTDPVAAGLVANLAHPGGNITGASGDPGRSDLNAKRLQIIKEVIPSTKRLGYLAPRGAWDLGAFGDVDREAQKAGLELLGPPLDGVIQEPEYRRVIAAMVASQVDALFVHEATENLVNAKLIVGLADQYRLPAVYPYREHIELGGLMGYVVEFRPVNRQMAIAADLILRGANPGEIPIHLPAQIEFLINSKAARALGLSIPQHLLALADEVVE